MELRIVRITDHFDAACRFYGEVLRWPVTREWDDAGRGRIFGYGDSARVELMEGEPSPMAGVFLSVETDDVVGLQQRLVAAGVTIDQPLTDRPWGHRTIGVTDPAGISLVFFEWISPAEPRA